jgi:hypothetical protein
MCFFFIPPAMAKTEGDKSFVFDMIPMADIQYCMAIILQPWMEQVRSVDSNLYISPTKWSQWAYKPQNRRSFHMGKKVLA